MKYLSLAFCLCYFSISHAQLRPAQGSFEKKWVKSETYDMTWYALRDTTTKIEIGRVSTQISEIKGQIVVVSSVSMKGMQGTWIDSSICEKTRFSPIRHASYNPQRDIVLNFGQIVTGSYTDKKQEKKTLINDTTHAAYFDSNLYPVLIRWLPLNNGFTQKIAIYDYNPSAKIGVISASVNAVSSATYSSQKSGLREVWIVDVTDEISNAKSQYIVDKVNRKLWKQSIEAGGRNMTMEVFE